MAFDWQTHDHYVLALLAVLGTFAAVLLLQWLIQRSPWATRLQSLQGVAPPFINIIGVLFGLTLAFLANDTWSAHDRAMNAVYREADALRSIAALAGTLPPPLRARVHGAVADYARSSAGEWAQLARRSENPDPRADVGTGFDGVGGDLFQALGTPLLRGRFLTTADSAENECGHASTPR